jgi:hypothetical protein
VWPKKIFIIQQKCIECLLHTRHEARNLNNDKEQETLYSYRAGFHSSIHLLNTCCLSSFYVSGILSSFLAAWGFELRPSALTRQVLYRLSHTRLAALCQVFLNVQRIQW